MNRTALRLVEGTMSEREDEHMGCPSEEELTLIAESLERGGDRAGAAQRSPLEEHLLACRPCANVVEAERLVLAQLRQLPDYGLGQALPTDSYFKDLGNRIAEAAADVEPSSRAPEEPLPRQVVVSLDERRWRTSGRGALALALSAAACLAVVFALQAPPTTAPGAAALADAEAEELEAFGALFGDSFLLGEPLFGETDSLLEDALLAEANEEDGERVGDALPLLEGLAPSGLTNEELNDLLDDWENRG